MSEETARRDPEGSRGVGAHDDETAGDSSGGSSGDVPGGAPAHVADPAPSTGNEPVAAETGADPESEPAARSDELQLDRADFSQDTVSAPTCASCNETIASQYFQVGQAVVCERCKDSLAAATATLRASGSMLRALLYGGAAAVVGSIVWYAIREITNLEIGLVAIAVGIVVGMGVKKGSGGIGGKRYQILAMVLTYASITFTNVPYVMRAFANAEQGAAAEAAGLAPLDPAADPNLPPGRSSEPMAPVKEEPAAALPPSPPPPLLYRVLGLGFIFAVAMAAPFLAGWENIIGILIIGIGLYEAWKFTREVTPPVSGPFPVSARATEEAREPESAQAKVA